jgi:hypothetical protein
MKSSRPALVAVATAVRSHAAEMVPALAATAELEGLPSAVVAAQSVGRPVRRGLPRADRCRLAVTSGAASPNTLCSTDSAMTPFASFLNQWLDSRWPAQRHIWHACSDDVQTPPKHGSATKLETAAAAKVAPAAPAKLPNRCVLHGFISNEGEFRLAVSNILKKNHVVHIVYGLMFYSVLRRLNPVSLRRFAYVAVSRASQDAMLFTDNAAQLGPQLAVETSKTAVLDAEQVTSIANAVGMSR